jgi:hypothetical protein
MAGCAGYILWEGEVFELACGRSRPLRKAPGFFIMKSAFHSPMRFFAALSLLFFLTTPFLAAQTAEAWQRSAVQKYPALAQAGSPMNQRFVALIAEKRTAEPAFFSKPDWPMRAADLVAAAIKAEDDKVKAAEEARLAAMSPDERDWEKNKARWVFERLVLGDGEETIVKKLNASKVITSRVSPSMRVPLGTHFQWVMGESKFRMDFEMKDDHLVAILFDCSPEKTSNLDAFVKDDWTKMRAAMVERYGQPTKSEPYPDDAKKLKKGGWTVTDSWEQKEFQIKLSIHEDDGRCNTVVRIGQAGGGEK